MPDRRWWLGDKGGPYRLGDRGGPYQKGDSGWEIKVDHIG